MAGRLVSWAAVAALSLVGACATLPTDPEERAEAEAVNDPLEPTNRAVFDLNMYLDSNIMEPVAQAYHDTFPDWFQQGLRNFLANIEEPYVAGNDLLQGNPKAAADALGRFLINSTFGMLGTQDALAESGGPKAHKTDIGITLGVWGFSEGPYLMLPFFGPSNLRDGTGRVADFWAHPTGAVMSAQGLEVFNYTQTGAEVLDTRTQYLDPIRELRRTSLDQYAAIRSLYRQNRDASIAASHAGQVKPGHETQMPARAGEASPQPTAETGPAAGAGAKAPAEAKPSAVEFVEPAK